PPVPHARAIGAPVRQLSVDIDLSPSPEVRACRCWWLSRGFQHGLQLCRHYRSWTPIDVAANTSERHRHRCRNRRIGFSSQPRPSRLERHCCGASTPPPRRRVRRRLLRNRLQSSHTPGSPRPPASTRLPVATVATGRRRRASPCTPVGVIAKDYKRSSNDLHSPWGSRICALPCRTKLC